MKLTINSRRSKAAAPLIGHIHRRATFAVGRFKDQIQAMSITLSDVNGPKGGDDKQCKVLIKLQSKTCIFIKERQSNLKEAIDLSLARASSNLKKVIKQRNEAERKGKRRINSVRYLRMNMQKDSAEQPALLPVPIN